MDDTGTEHRYFVRAGARVVAVHKEREAPASLMGEASPADRERVFKTLCHLVSLTG